MTDNLSDFLVFVDESGDHGLEAIDKDYPLFVLAFCIIQKREYVERLTPALQAFKLKHFGHDNVVLHEREIRKDIGDFAFLKTSARKEAFSNELADIVAATHFTLVCTVIRKELLKLRYTKPENPYTWRLGLDSNGYRTTSSLRGSERRSRTFSWSGVEEKKMLSLSLNFVECAMAGIIRANGYPFRCHSSISKRTLPACNWPTLWLVQ